jgi:hypothetical protein
MSNLSLEEMIVATRQLRDVRRAILNLLKTRFEREDAGTLAGYVSEGLALERERDAVMNRLCKPIPVDSLFSN